MGGSKFIVLDSVWINYFFLFLLETIWTTYRSFFMNRIGRVLLSTSLASPRTVAFFLRWYNFSWRHSTKYGTSNYIVNRNRISSLLFLVFTFWYRIEPDYRSMSTHKPMNLLASGTQFVSRQELIADTVTANLLQGIAMPYFALPRPATLFGTLWYSFLLRFGTLSYA